MKESAIHPIIYVRGYAMTQSEIEDTVADPYMGFNLGSSKTRQLWDGTIKRFFFESPIVRLMKEFGYDDVYEEGMDQVVDKRAERKSVPYRSIIIYRYYEPSSQDLGTGVKPNIDIFATGISDLILGLRNRIYPQGKETVISEKDKSDGMLPYADFRVYLLAHSMGGLVCRAFLQNPKYGKNEARGLVDKVFTYATPHNGIDVKGLGNIPEWVALFGINTFNRDEMARYLGLNKTDRVDGAVNIVKNYDPGRIFNLVGTNPGDYKVASGLSSLVTGAYGDGLVRMENATTRGKVDGVLMQSPNAFVHRSHSGHYGIVNSEEGYQNLIRFLYGDVRADGYLDIDELTLPPVVQKERDEGKDVKASYLFEITVSIRGKQWQLHRRVANENSAIFRRFDELFPKRTTDKTWVSDLLKSPLLFNVFLDMHKSQTGNSLAFSADISVRVPEYEVDGFLFLKNHFEGSYLFRDQLTIEAYFPNTPDDEWKIEYQFASQRGEPPKLAEINDTKDELIFKIPIEQLTPPGIRATLRVITTFWNR
jgi:hypothetical protein